MRGHAAAFTWEIAQRYRWGWGALALWLAVLAAMRVTVVVTDAPLFAGWGAGYAFAVVCPGTAALYWFIAIFTHGTSGSVAGKRSLFPRRLLTLPVTSDALATWPMVAGGAAVAILWFTTRLLAPWPDDLARSVPAVWPGLMAMALLAWSQAIIWGSYPMRGLRVALAAIVLSLFGVASSLAFELRVGEGFMVALLAPQLPLAWLVARRVVAGARHDEAPDWRVGAWLDRILVRRRSARPAFRSAAHAQRWLEWQRFGRSLPVMVAIVVPLELLLLWIARDAPAIVFTLLFLTALTPPFMATFTALAARRSNAEDFGLAAFTATKPMSSAALVGARLSAAAVSTIVAWGLVLVMVPVALWLSETWPIVSDRAQRIASVTGWARLGVAVGLMVIGLLLTTWRQMVQSLYLGLLGRATLVRASALIMLVLLVAIAVLWDVMGGFVGRWFWMTLFIGTVLIVVARMAVGSWVIMCLHHERVISTRSLLRGAVAWLVTVAVIYGLLLWWFSTPIIPRFLLLGIATLMVPFVRVSAAPLTLARNRHG